MFDLSVAERDEFIMINFRFVLGSSQCLHTRDEKGEPWISKPASMHVVFFSNVCPSLATTALNWVPSGFVL